MSHYNKWVCLLLLSMPPSDLLYSIVKPAAFRFIIFPCQTCRLPIYYIPLSNLPAAAQETFSFSAPYFQEGYFFGLKGKVTFYFGFRWCAWHWSFLILRFFHLKSPKRYQNGYNKTFFFSLKTDLIKNMLIQN